MRRTETLAAVTVLALACLAGCPTSLDGQGTATPAPTQEVSPTDHPQVTQTPDGTVSPTPVPPPTPSPTPTGAAAPTATSSPTPTATATPTPTATATPTPTATATPTPTPASSEPADVVLRGGNLSVDEDRIYERVEDPGTLSRLYSSGTPTPRTTEQLIHGLAPAEEPELNLSVSVAGGRNWTTPPRARDTKGETVVRTMLRVELNRSLAAPAAAGWGSDRLVRLTHADDGSRDGFAWALRWDTPADADEFAAAFDRWTAERPADAPAYRLTRLTDETVVVFAGDPGFVGNASATGTTGNVTVVPGP
ncbi:MAG: hypothetical protein ABEJ40_04000 [Haloarculaceae archaeon]